MCRKKQRNRWKPRKNKCLLNKNFHTRGFFRETKPNQFCISLVLCLIVAKRKIFICRKLKQLNVMQIFFPQRNFSFVFHISSVNWESSLLQSTGINSIKNDGNDFCYQPCVWWLCWALIWTIIECLKHFIVIECH